jgi:hypothetical protein
MSFKYLSKSKSGEHGTKTKSKSLSLKEEGHHPLLVIGQTPGRSDDGNAHELLFWGQNHAFLVF